MATCWLWHPVKGLFPVRISTHTSNEKKLKQVKSVEDVLSIPGAIAFKKDSVTEKLSAEKIFADTDRTQQQLDSAKAVFLNLPFYRSLLYNDLTHAYLMGVRINKDVLNSPGRTKVVAEITAAVNEFSRATKIETHLSGLPLIQNGCGRSYPERNEIVFIRFTCIKRADTFIFFRSLSTTLISLAVVIIGVVWTIGITYLCGYNITFLTALIPSLGSCYRYSQLYILSLISTILLITMKIFQ